MFETIVLRRHQNDAQAIDAGLLAETLLFYDNVHIVADGGTLFALASKIGKDNVIELLESHHIKMTWSLAFTAPFPRWKMASPSTDSSA